MSNDPYGFNFIIAQALKKHAFGLIWSVEQSSSRMVLSCCPHPQSLSQQFFSEPAQKISPCSRNKPYLHTPIPVLLTHSFFHFLCRFISESLHYFLESEAVSRKGCESIFPHARLVSNLVISTAYGKRFKWTNIQEKNGKASRHPTEFKDEEKGSETSITYSSSHVFNKHDSCHAVL